MTLQGRVFGGNQPVTASTIQLYAAGTGVTGTASTALISAIVTTSDGTGLANPNANAGNGNNSFGAGYFNISGDYTCPTADTQVYLTAQGGNPGAGTFNPNIAVMVALGSCGYLSSATNLTVNEVTTVGTLAGIYPYTTGFAAVSSPATTSTSLAEEFSLATEYMDRSAGVAPGLNLPSGYYGSSTEINTLADAVATCVNSSGGRATNGTSDGSACGNLFAAATVGNGVSPTDTAGAVLNILNNPTNKVGTIFNLVPGLSPFQPTLVSVPADWTLPLVPLPQAPIALPVAGSYVQAQTVTLASATNGATIYYTLDGSAPTTKSNSYTGPVAVSATGTLTAMAANRAGVSAAAATAYSITGAPALPVISLAPGTYSAPQVVTITSSADVSAIYATIDGSTPTTSSLRVLGPLQVGQSETLKAIATFGGATSAVASAVYTFAPVSQTITTLAGTSTPYADNIPASAAALNNPFGIAVDLSGNVYVADSTNNRVRKISAQTGIITTLAGGGTGLGDGGPATNSIQSAPRGVAVDAAGNVYIADTNQYRIRKVTAATGVITTVAGNGVLGYFGDNGQAQVAELNSPYGVAVDASGNLYITTLGDSRIRKVTASTGVITTIAGTGTAGFSGDNGKATSAMINRPYGTSVDASGNLYIADYQNDRIRKITASTGIITTVAGTGTTGYGGDGGPAISGQMGAATGVAVDASGNVYLADSINYRVRKVTAATGNISTVAGSGTGGYAASQDGGPATAAQLTTPRAVAVDVNGNLYIADASRIRKVTAAGVITTIAGTGTNGFAVLPPYDAPGTQSTITSPWGVVGDSAGNIYYSENSGNRVRRIAAGTGLVTTVAGTGVAGFSGDGGAGASAQLSAPGDLAYDPAGKLYIADVYNNRIRMVTLSTGVITTVAGSGSVGSLPDGGLAVNAALFYPSGVAVDKAGNLYLADTRNNKIRIVSPAGIISTFAGNGTAGFTGDGGPATAAELNYPSSLAIDAGGRLYVNDNVRVRVISGGVISTVEGFGTSGFAGDGGAATTGETYAAVGIYVDASGNLYIADSGNYRIRKVTGGIISTIAGNGTASFSGDGGPATAATMYYPQGVFVDAAGNMYVADSRNNRIRVVYH